jgi:cell division protein YceG involved in septum cleavage
MKKKTWMILLLISMFLIGMTKLVYASFLSNDNYCEVIIQEGETLWDIASRYHEQAGMSTQELLFYIQKENDLQSAIVYPGDSIVIPINQ